MAGTILNNSTWTTLRNFDPGAGTTFSDPDWLTSQDYAQATATGLAVISSSRGEGGDLAELGVMVTLLDASGNVVGADQISTVITTIHIEEIAQVAGGQRSRVLGVGTITSMATAGVIGIGRTAAKIPRGVYVVRLAGVSGMPAGVKNIVIALKLV